MGAKENQIKLRKNRRRGRIRSKISRDRKKSYIFELENRVKELEKENFRLQNLLVRYRNDRIENTDSSTQTLIKDIKECKLKIIENFIDPETMKFKKNSFSIATHFKAISQEVVRKHKTFLDGIFRMIINNPYPVSRFTYWSILTPTYTTKYEVIRKFNKCTKYKVSEYIRK